MFIGVGRFELFIPAGRSLKGKRQITRSVTETVRRKFNVSIAEVDHLDLWQRTAFGVTCVAGTRTHCQRIMQEVEKTIGRAALGGAEIVERTVEIVSEDDL